MNTNNALNWSSGQHIYANIIKRIIDILVAIVALPFLAVILIIVSPIIYLSDRGSVFYTAERIGRNGKLFRMFKFRSMKMNAPDIRLSDGSTYNGSDDPRVTKIGRFLRSTSIDEAPQVLNMLMGDMSLIGPRPDPPDWLDKYPDEIKPFLLVRPGITGYNQAFFRNLADGEQKMRNDVYYAKHCSLRLDIKIFFQTIAVVVLHKGMYKDTRNEESALKQADEV